MGSGVWITTIVRSRVLIFLMNPSGRHDVTCFGAQLHILMLLNHLYIYMTSFLVILCTL